MEPALILLEWGDGPETRTYLSSAVVVALEARTETPQRAANIWRCRGLGSSRRRIERGRCRSAHLRGAYVSLSARAAPPLGIPTPHRMHRRAELFSARSCVEERCPE